MKTIEKPVLFIGKIVLFIMTVLIPLYLFVFPQIVARGINYYIVEYLGVEEYFYDAEQIASIRAQMEYEREEREERDNDYAYDDYDNDYDYDLSR